MNKNILKLADIPIRGYPDYAYPLSVILNYKDSYEWLYCNFIQLYFYEDEPDNLIRYYYSDINNRLWDVRNPLLNYQIIHKDLIKDYEFDIINFIIRMIDKGYYLYFYIDEYYLPNRLVYQNRHKLHVNFFYGYDLDSRKLYIAGYDNNLQYSYDQVDFDIISKSYHLTNNDYYDDKNLIYLFKYNDTGSKYKFDKEVIRLELIEFLNSKDSSKRYSNCFNSRKNMYFGLAVYERLISHIKNDKKDDFTKPIYIIWEHKNLMCSRIEYMINNGYIKTDSISKIMYIELEQISKEILHLYIKYLVTKNIGIIDKILIKLDNIIEKENIAIVQLINDIL